MTVALRPQGPGMPVRRVEAWAAALVLVTAVAGFAAFAGARVAAAQAAAACLIFSLLFVPLAALSVTSWVEALARWLSPAPWLRAGVLLMAGIVLAASQAAATGIPVGRPVAWLVVAGGAAIALLGAHGVASRPMDHPVRLGLAILALWLPSELGLVHGLPLPAGIPAGAFEAGRLLTLDLGLLLFLAVAPLPDVGYAFRLRRGDLVAAATSLAVFAAVAIPLGLALGFIHWGLTPFQPLTWLVRGLAIYFFIAVPEELLFRGAVQNLIEKRWPGRHARVGSLLVAAVIFGASHLNNGSAPNWRYMLLATLAGVAYGWTWQRTRRISASALTHAAVDWIWVTALRG